MKAAIEESEADKQNGEKEEDKQDLKRKGTMQETVEVRKKSVFFFLFTGLLSRFSGTAALCSKIVQTKFRVKCCLSLSHGNLNYDNDFRSLRKSGSTRENAARNVYELCISLFSTPRLVSVSGENDIVRSEYCTL